MKKIMFSDVKIDPVRGYLKITLSPVLRKENEDLVEFLTKSNYNDLNNMFKLRLIPKKENYFEVTKEFSEWFDRKYNYELFQVFVNGILEDVFLKKITNYLD